MKRSLISSLRLTLSAFLVFSTLAPAAWAQGFAAYISPPRFEIRTQPGESLREVVEIQHVGREKGSYRLYTNDWTMGPDNGVAFTDALAPDSCRPWVAIERRELTLEPGARYRYRFQIDVPAGTAPRECRFALMVEGLDPAEVKGALNFPVSGRIGVIVYARIGGAKPNLVIVGQQVTPINGQPAATLDIRNTGNATGRLEGFLDATDADGKSVELSPTDLPILPGDTRRITLNPVAEDGKPPPPLRMPMQVKGELEWDDNRLPVETRFLP
ncbi:MAG: hypothetical protein R3E56_14930 [Burkholderiaceae bacterium]